MRLPEALLPAAGSRRTRSRGRRRNRRPLDAFAFVFSFTSTFVASTFVNANSSATTLNRAHRKQNRKPLLGCGRGQRLGHQPSQTQRTAGPTQQTKTAAVVVRKVGGTSWPSREDEPKETKTRTKRKRQQQQCRVKDKEKEGEEEEEKKERMLECGSTSTGEREKRSKKRRRKRISLSLLVFVLFSHLLLAVNLFGSAEADGILSGTSSKGSDTSPSSSSLVVMSSSSELAAAAATALIHDDANELATKSDILKKTRLIKLQKQTKEGNPREFGRVQANNSIGLGGQTDNNNNNNNTDTDKRRRLSESNESHREKEEKSDTDSSDNDNETDNGTSENDNSGGGGITNIIRGYNDGDDDAASVVSSSAADDADDYTEAEADDNSDDNANANITATTSTLLHQKPANSASRIMPVIFGSAEVTRLHSFGQLSSPTTDTEKDKQVRASSSASDDALDDSADDYNDYGAYVIYENEQQEDNEHKHQAAAISNKMEYASMTAANRSRELFDETSLVALSHHQAAVAPHFQQVFYASKRSSGPRLVDESYVDEHQHQKRDRDESDQERSVSNPSPVSASNSLPTLTLSPRNAAHKTKTRRHQFPTTGKSPSGPNDSGHRKRKEEENDSDGYNDEDDDVKWLRRMMIASEATTRKPNVESNQRDLLSLSSSSSREKQRQQEVTNEGIHMKKGGEQLWPTNSARDLSRGEWNGSQQEGTESHKELHELRQLEETEKGEHNVYYWRLIWFVLPVGATFGNLLVIMAVYLEKSLQSVTNYFIVSLAFADLFVGLIVMPFAVYVLVNEVWELSDAICDIYVAVDVTSSTASILNLVAISIDRYRAVAHPIAYSARKSSTRAILTILLVWFISCCVGAPIILGLNTSPERNSSLCILYNSTFIFWSSLTSFYVPCIIMIGLYWRIFLAIRSRTKKAIRAGSHAPSQPATATAPGAGAGAAPTLAAVAHHLHNSSTTTGAVSLAANHKPAGESSQLVAVVAAAQQQHKQQSNSTTATKTLDSADEIILSGAKLQTTAQEAPPDGQRANIEPAATTAHQSIQASQQQQQQQQQYKERSTSGIGGATKESEQMSSIKPRANQIQRQQEGKKSKDGQVNGSDRVEPSLSLSGPDNGRAESGTEVVAGLVEPQAQRAKLRALPMTGTSYSNQSRCPKSEEEQQRRTTTIKQDETDQDAIKEAADAEIVCPLGKWRKHAQAKSSMPSVHLIELLFPAANNNENSRSGENCCPHHQAEVNDHEDRSRERKEVTRAHLRLAIGRPLSCRCHESKEMKKMNNLRDGKGEGVGTCLEEFFMPNVMKFSQDVGSFLLAQNRNRSSSSSMSKIDCFDAQQKQQQQQQQHSSPDVFLSAKNLSSAMAASIRFASNHYSAAAAAADGTIQQLELCLSTDLPAKDDSSPWIYIEFNSLSQEEAKKTNIVGMEQTDPPQADKDLVNLMGEKLKRIEHILDRLKLSQSCSSAVEFTVILHQKCQALKQDFDTNKSCDMINDDDDELVGTCCECCGSKMERNCQRETRTFNDKDKDNKQLDEANLVQLVCIRVSYELVETTDRRKLAIDNLSFWNRVRGFELLQVYREDKEEAPFHHQIMWFNKKPEEIQLLNGKFRMKRIRGDEFGKATQLCSACEAICLVGKSLSFNPDSSSCYQQHSDLSLACRNEPNDSNESDEKESIRLMGKSAASLFPSSIPNDASTTNLPAQFRSSSWAMIDSRNSGSNSKLAQSDKKEKFRQTSLAECVNLSKLLEEERLRQIKCHTVCSSNGSRVNYCPSYEDEEDDNDDDDDDDDEEEEDDEDEEEDEEEDYDDNPMGPTSRCRSSHSNSHCSNLHSNDDGKGTNSSASSRSSLSSSGWSLNGGYECSTTTTGRRMHCDSRRSSHPSSCCHPSPTCFACQQQQQQQSGQSNNEKRQIHHKSSGGFDAACQHSRAELTPTDGSKSRKHPVFVSREHDDGATVASSRIQSSSKQAATQHPESSTSQYPPASQQQQQQPHQQTATMSVIQNATLKLKRRSLRFGKFLKQTTLKTAGLVDSGSLEGATPPSVTQTTTKNQSSDDPFSSSVLATNVPTNMMLSTSPSRFSITNNQTSLPAQTTTTTTSSMSPTTSQTVQGNHQSTTLAGGGGLMSPEVSLSIVADVGGSGGFARKSAAPEPAKKAVDEPSSSSTRNLDEEKSCTLTREMNTTLKRQKQERQAKSLRWPNDVEHDGDDDDGRLECQRQQRRDIKRSFLVASVINLIQQQQQQQQQQQKLQKGEQLKGAAHKRSQRAKKDGQVVSAIATTRQHRAGGSRRRREKNAARRERKATKTLAIVLGIFLICWTPFFTCNIIDGICIQLNMDCRPGMMVYLVTSWLGYINSCVNPIIYTIFNMEFRRAFKKILKSISCC